MGRPGRRGRNCLGSAPPARTPLPPAGSTTPTSGSGACLRTASAAASVTPAPRAPRAMEATRGATTSSISSPFGLSVNPDTRCFPDKSRLASNPDVALLAEHQGPGLQGEPQALDEALGVLLVVGLHVG